MDYHQLSCLNEVYSAQRILDRASRRAWLYAQVKGFINSLPSRDVWEIRDWWRTRGRVLNGVNRGRLCSLLERVIGEELC